LTSIQTADRLKGIATITVTSTIINDDRTQAKSFLNAKFPAPDRFRYQGACNLSRLNAI
jgi:hypothetical protein